MAGAALSGVGATALGVARSRAEENRRDDGLVEDPFAEAITTAAAGAGSAWSSLPRGVAAFFDLLTDQVAVADVLAFRDGALLAGESDARARCERTPVGVDLRDDWPAALVRAGLDPAVPTAWLAEGLLYALPTAAADVLLDRITALSSPASTLAFDQIRDSTALRAARADVAPELVDLWLAAARAWLGTATLDDVTTDGVR